jgi:hypothetical protein
MQLNHPLHLPFRLWAQSLLHRPVEMLLCGTLLLLALGATAVYAVDHGPGSTLHSWWDALWMCVTSINENYGDVRPTTSLDRLVITLVATLGIVLVGSFTAAITNYMLGDSGARQAAALCEIRDRLERIEQQLAQREQG